MCSPNGWITAAQKKKSKLQINPWVISTSIYHTKKKICNSRAKLVDVYIKNYAIEYPYKKNFVTNQINKQGHEYF